MAALQANGIPVANAFYNDQLVSSTWSAPPSPSLSAAAVGTWNRLDGGEAVALAVTFEHYSMYQQMYKAAFVAALAGLLNVPNYAITVIDFERSSAGTTVRRLPPPRRAFSRSPLARRLSFSTTS